VICLDTSVALAHLFAEDVNPPDSLWGETPVASRLLEYEMWTRVNARGLGAVPRRRVRALLARVSFLELSPLVLARVLAPFPVVVRTRDAIHLASLLFLQTRAQAVALASYDEQC